MKVALGEINKYSARGFLVAAILGMLGLLGASSAIGADLIVSGNDAKFVREGGVGGYPEGVGPDTLTVIDASVFPPRGGGNGRSSSYIIWSSPAGWDYP